MSDITFTGHHIDVTEALKEFTTNKFARLKKHYDRIIGIDVVFDVQKQSQIAKAKITVPGAVINASAEREDMYAAIDALADELNRQLIKHKEKHSHP